MLYKEYIKLLKDVKFIMKRGDYDVIISKMDIKKSRINFILDDQKVKNKVIKDKTLEKIINELKNIKLCLQQ